MSDFSGLPPYEPRRWTASTTTAVVLALLLGAAVFAFMVLVDRVFEDLP